MSLIDNSDDVKTSDLEHGTFLNNLDDGDKIVSIFGWAFKKNTNDSRESASIYLAKILIENHIKVNVYDPMVSKERIIDDLNQLGLEANSSVLEVFKSPDQAAESSSGIAFCTEWDEFKTLDFKTIFKLMGNSPWIFDGRNTLNINLLEECGFNVYSIGK